MSESIPWVIAGCFVIALTCIVGLKGCQITTDALDSCIKTTQKPLECKSAYDHK